MKPDWPAIRERYLQGGISMRELSAQFGVLFTTLGKRAKREDWVLARRLAQEQPPAISEPPTLEALPTTAADSMAALPTGFALKARIAKELDRDVAAVAKVEPTSLAVAGERQDVLASVASVGKAIFDWGTPTPLPLVRVNIIGSAVLHTPEPDALPVDEP